MAGSEIQRSRSEASGRFTSLPKWDIEEIDRLVPIISNPDIDEAKTAIEKYLTHALLSQG